LRIVCILCNGNKIYLSGGLTYYIGNVLLQKGLKDCSLVLIDNTSPRHKHDNKLSETSLQIHRIRIDIKDIVVDRLPAVESGKTKHVVSVAKHLCGAALGMIIGICIPVFDFNSFYNLEFVYRHDPVCFVRKQ